MCWEALEAAIDSAEQDEAPSENLHTSTTWNCVQSFSSIFMFGCILTQPPNSPPHATCLQYQHSFSLFCLGVVFWWVGDNLHRPNCCFFTPKRYLHHICAPPPPPPLSPESTRQPSPSPSPATSLTNPSASRQPPKPEASSEKPLLFKCPVLMFLFPA